MNRFADRRDTKGSAFRLLSATRVHSPKQDRALGQADRVDAWPPKLQSQVVLTSIEQPHTSPKKSA